MKAFVAGLSAVHDPGERFWFEYERALGPEVVRPARQAFPGVEHPVVSAHPVTGEPLLFVNRGYTTRIAGVTPARADGCWTCSSISSTTRPSTTGTSGDRATS